MSQGATYGGGIDVLEDDEVERNFQLALQRIERARSAGRKEEIVVFGEWPRHGRMVGKVGDRIKAAGYGATLHADDADSDSSSGGETQPGGSRSRGMQGLVWVTARWAL
jgi:hypothetical protein